MRFWRSTTTGRVFAQRMRRLFVVLRAKAGPSRAFPVPHGDGRKAARELARLYGVEAVLAEEMETWRPTGPAPSLGALSAAPAAELCKGSEKQ